MTDAERIFRALRRTSGPYRDLYVRWAPLPDDRYGESIGMVFLHPVTCDGDDKAVDTLVHELLHFLEPEKPENWVRARTKRIMGSLTDRQRRRLTRFLASVR